MLPPQIPHLINTGIHVELSGGKSMEVRKMSGLAGLIYGVGKKFVSQKHAMTGDIIMTHPGPKNIGSSRPPPPDESQNGNLLSVEFLKAPPNPSAPSDKDIVEGMGLLGDAELLRGDPSLL